MVSKLSKFEAIFSIEKISPLFSELDLQITTVVRSG